MKVIEPVATLDVDNDDEKKPEDEEESVKDEEEEAPVQEDEDPIEEREPEEHEEYVPSQDGEKESEKEFQPYDPNDIMEIEVKVSTKVKGLKKLILEKIDLVKKANIIMLKKCEQGIQKQMENTPPQWTEMTESDLEQQVKMFMNQTIAFKAFMNISVLVEGRGQSYHQ